MKLASLLVAVATLVAACGDGETRFDPPTAGGEPIDLPPVGTLWTAPSGESVVPVNVDADGRIYVEGKGPLSLIGLRDEMRRHTDVARWREPDNSSRKILLLNADQEVPWAVCMWVLMVAADPTIGLYRIEFGARPAEGAGFGSIGVRLPRNPGIVSARVFIDDLPLITVKLFAKEDLEADADPEHLYEAIQRKWLPRMHESPVVMFEIRTPAPYGLGVPAGFVVRVIDVAKRAGMQDLALPTALPPDPGEEDDVEALLAHVAELRAQRGKIRIRLGDSLKWDGNPGARPLPPTNARGLTQRSESPESVGAAPREWLEDGELDESAPPVPVPFTPLGEGIDGPGSPSPKGLIDIDGGDRGAFGCRREREARAGESGPRRRAAVEDALRWLAAHQSPNGGWEASGFHAWCDGAATEEGPDGAGKALYDSGVTGLAICAFLGAGYTSRGRHPYAKTVSKGLRYIKNVQDAEGCYGPRTGRHYIYNHACAALAMVEAYGMTESPIFRASAQKALDFIALARNPDLAWRYGVKAGDNDTSVTGWMAAVLHAAELIGENHVARGRSPRLVVDEYALAGAKAWMDQMTHADSGRAGYLQRGTGSARRQELVDRFPCEKSEAVTAIAILVRMICGEDPRESETIRKGAALCAKLPPRWNPTDGSIDMYYWYHGSLALFQVGGPAWKTWNDHLDTSILDNQRRDTTPCLYMGSWDPIGPWGEDGGRVYATALMAMCLEVEYRYERLFGAR